MPEETNITEQIERLIALQQIDAEVFDLQSKKDGFPVRLKEIEDSLQEKTAGIHAAEEELKRLQVLKNEKETDMQAKEGKIAKYESDLYTIKNNKEYKALQDEISSIKADVSLVEEMIINYFDEIEAAQAKLEEEKKIFADENKKTEEEKNSIKADEKALSDKINALSARRDEAAGGIATDVLAQYERILQHMGRTALSKVENEFCAECNMHLRPQVLNDAKLKKALVFCENCGRILYAD